MIPGSHRAGRPPEADDTHWNGIEQGSVMVKAGDVVLHRSEMWHRGSANIGSETRYLVQVPSGCIKTGLFSSPECTLSLAAPSEKGGI